MVRLPLASLPWPVTVKARTVEVWVPHQNRGAGPVARLVTAPPTLLLPPAGVVPVEMLMVVTVPALPAVTTKLLLPGMNLQAARAWQGAGLVRRSSPPVPTHHRQTVPSVPQLTNNSLLVDRSKSVTPPRKGNSFHKITLRTKQLLLLCLPLCASGSCVVTAGGWEERQ